MPVSTLPGSSPSSRKRSSRRRSSARGPSPHGTRIRSQGGARHAPAAAPAQGFLRRLGLFGFERLEPVVLAALVTGEPLLLIGAHGTAKSLLLLRLCEALGLERRHYNASLLNYEDLVGYPLPDADGRLRFVETPASIWPAEAVFLDEISRCRVDMQNRLFPILHERRVQGIELAKLRYRWAAMNPPPGDDDLDAALYRGSEKLDAALADRFAFVVETPRWGDLADDDRDAVIRSVDAPVGAAAASALADAISRATTALALVDDEFGRGVVDYVRTVVGLLAQAGVALSPRRAAILRRNVLAVLAAEGVLRGSVADVSSTVHLALECSLPQRAEGRAVPALQVLTCHREAAPLLAADTGARRRRLLSELSPVRRALLALDCDELDDGELTAFVADGLAAAPPGGRHALALHLVESGKAARLGAAVAEQVAELYAHGAVAQDVAESLASGSPRHLAWQDLVRVLASLPQDDAATARESARLGNVLSALFASGTLSKPGEAALAVESWNSVRSLVAATVAAEGGS